jgi:Fic family protein
MRYIHELPNWPQFSYEMEMLATKLADIRCSQGLLLGKMAMLGFDLQDEAHLTMLSSDIIQTSAIEGEILATDAVRSSLARRLGLDDGGVKPLPRSEEGIVEIMLEACQNYASPLTDERLFSWHAALFPTGWSGLHKIEVAQYRKGSMQVVSGPLGRERVHFEAPDASRLKVEMQHFLAWFNNEKSLDPVLKAAIAHFWFMTIHP